MNLVLFDLLHAQPFGEIKFHGGGEYIKSVFEEFIKHTIIDAELQVCFDQDSFLDDWILEAIRDKNITVRQVKTAHDVVRIINGEAKINAVKFFTGMIYPYDNEDFSPNVTKIGVCHGIRTIEKPYDSEAWRYASKKAEVKECISKTLLPERSIRKAKESFAKVFEKFDIIITDSNHSYYSIKTNFPKETADTDIRVLYTPVKYAELAKQAENNGAPYILMISANRWLKNSYRGAMAIDQLYQSGYLKGIRTRVYGSLPEKIQNKLVCKENFDFYGYVSTEELEGAYCGCDVFFYPTLNEGFGLPPLEAMKYGKTCVISGVCSLPEVYGDSVYYCNPYDIMEMSNRLLMATECKIPEDVIQRQIEKVHTREQEDLIKLCQFISWEVSDVH